MKNKSKIPKWNFDMFKKMCNYNKRVWIGENVDTWDVVRLKSDLWY